MNLGDHGLGELDLDVCIELLCSRSVGRLALSWRSLPVVVPVGYVVDRDAIVVRTDPGAVSSVTPDTVVAFEVDEFDERVGSGWSVLVQGLARELPAVPPLPAEVESVLSRWAEPAGSRHLSIPIDLVSGRRLPLGHPVPRG